MAILVGFLAIGLLCNLMIRPLNAKWFAPEELAHEKHLAHDRAVANEVGSGPGLAGGGNTLAAVVAPGLGCGGDTAGLGHLANAGERGQVLPLSRPAVQI